MGLPEGNSMKYVPSYENLDLIGMSIQLRSHESDKGFDDIPLVADAGGASLPDLDPPNVNCWENIGLSTKRASSSNYLTGSSKRRFLSVGTEFTSGSEAVDVNSFKDDPDGILRQRKLFLEIVSMRMGGDSNEPVQEATSIDEIVEHRESYLDAVETRRKPVTEATVLDHSREVRKLTNEGLVGESPTYAFEKDFRNLGYFSSGKIKAHCDGLSPRNTCHSLESLEDGIFALPDLECPSYNLQENDMKYKGTKRNRGASQRRKFPQVCSPEITTVCDAVEGDIDGMSRARKLFLDIVSGKKFGVSAGRVNKEVEERMKYIYDSLVAFEKHHETSCADKVLKKEMRKPIRLVSSLSKMELQHLLRKHRSKLRDIYYGKVFSRRHEDYKRGGKAKCQLTFQVNISPFRDEQLDHVVQFLMAQFYGKPIKDANYILKVLLAEALVFIYMDFHGIDYGECDKRMVEAAFNEENAEFL